MTTTTDTTNLSAIDRAIAAAKARKAAKAAGAQTNPAASPEGASAGTKSRTPVLDQIEKAKAAASQKLAKDAERNEKRVKLEAERAERKLAREAKKAAKALERDAKNAGHVAHMAKVDKAAAKLPPMTDAVKDIFQDAVSNLSAANVAILAAHLTHFNRAKATERAIGTKVEVGTIVEITGGDPKYMGLVGEVVRSQRIRCFVEVPGRDKEIYCFISDVTPVATVADEVTEETASDEEVTEAPEAEVSEEVEATGTDG